MRTYCKFEPKIRYQLNGLGAELRYMGYFASLMHPLGRKRKLLLVLYFVYCYFQCFGVTLVNYRPFTEN